jgi:hypothetical protein
LILAFEPIFEHFAYRGIAEAQSLRDFAKDERIENEEQDFVMDHRCIDGGQSVRRNGNQATDFR